MNLISASTQGKTCNIFFNIDHKSYRIEDLKVTSGGFNDTAWELSHDERESLIDLIVSEITISNIERAAFIKAHGDIHDA
jgi:hypothetical protein